jgi:hypothetical protein
MQNIESTHTPADNRLHNNVWLLLNDNCSLLVSRLWWWVYRRRLLARRVCKLSWWIDTTNWRNLLIRHGDRDTR